MRRVTFVAALAVLCLVLVTAVPAGTARARATTFTDQTGDAGTAADVSTVVVSTDANGQITFQVDVANEFSPTDTIDVFVDSDGNGSTGDAQARGAEYDLLFDFSDQTWDVGVWNGSNWIEAPHATVKVASTTSQVTFSINKSELGDTTSFGFWVDSCDGDCSAGHEDQAPASGVWAYQRVRISVVSSVAPKTVKAGARYTAAMLLRASDPSVSLVDGGQVQCKASVGLQAISAHGGLITETVQGQKVSAAACAARVPKTAGGKTVKETVTVTYQGMTVSRSFAARVTQ